MKDNLLIEGLRLRDKIIFDYIFNAYYSTLCAFSMQYLHDRNAVEDLVQDFFVMIWIDASRLQINSSLKSYLFTGIKNRCLDFHKHLKVTEKYKAFFLFAAEKENNSFDHLLIESELHQAIEIGLSKLPPRCREIFELRRIKGLTNKQIAVELGISKRTVELQISNSFKILRKELVDYLPLWPVVWLIG